MRADLLAQCGLSAAVGREVLAEMHAAQFSATLNLSQAPRALPDLADRYAIAPVLTINDIRRQNLVALIEEANTAAALGDRSGISASLISQWKNGSPDSKTGKPRQISSDSCRRIELAMGKQSGWMDQQRGTPAQPSPEGVSVHPVAQDLSHPTFEDEPQQHPWEFIVSVPTSDLPKRFRAAMPDDALAPDTPRGLVLHFNTDAEPVIGHGVLVQDAAGGRHVRRYAQGLGGAWRAEARNTAYMTLHSGDGVQLLAVVTGKDSGAV